MDKVKQITSYLKDTFLELKGIYLFDSQGYKTAKEDSDWYITLLFLHTYCPENQLIWEVRWNLGGVINAPIYLIDPCQISILTRAKIISTAQTIYSADDFYCDMYETTTYSMRAK